MGEKQVDLDDLSRKPAAESDQEQLAELISLADGKAAEHASVARAAWSAADLAAIWRHQLSAPLLLDLGGISAEANAVVTRYTQSSQTLDTFADLLQHPTPPIELLQLTRQFAKVHRLTDATVFPIEIANVLYYSAIVVAILRLGSRITRMDNIQLQYSFRWCLQQSWIDPATRELFETALRRKWDQPS